MKSQTLSLFVLILCTCTAAAQPEWKPFGNLATARCCFNALYIGGGKIMVVGGSSGVPGLQGMNARPLSSCEIIDVWEHSVYDVASMNVPRSEFTALLTPDSNVVVISGVTGTDPNGQLTPVVEMYNRISNQWRVVGSLNTPRRQLVAGFIDDHRILVVGGRHKDYSSIAEVEIFDLATGTSQPAASYPMGTTEAKAVQSSTGRLLVFGGREGGTNSRRNAEVLAYDPINDTWLENGSLTSAVRWPSRLRLRDGRVVVTGGWMSETPIEIGGDVQIEDQGEWSTVTQPIHPRSDGEIAQWNDSRILLIGGVYEDDVTVSTTEWIDLEERRGSTGPEMRYPRRAFTALSAPVRNSSLSESAIIAISGQRNATTLTPSIEILEPETSSSDAAMESISRPATTIRAYPNPFTGTTAINYTLAASAHVRLSIFDSRGTRRRTIVDGRQEPGTHSHLFDAIDLPTGIYLCRLQIGEELQSLWITVLH